MTTPELAMFDEIDEASEVEADARAEADVAAGRTVSHKAMRTWLLSWVTSNEKPPPADGD